MVVKQPVAPPPPDVPFPFDVQFQLKLLKLVILDGGLVHEAMRWVQPHYFDTPELRWVCHHVQSYFGSYDAVPSVSALRQLGQQETKLGPTIHLVLDQLESVDLTEEAFIKDKFLDWVRQSLFHQSFREATGLWNNGKRNDAMEHLSRKMEDLHQIRWSSDLDVVVGESYGERQQLREQVQEDLLVPSIPTGLDDVDKVLDGGLSKGELGVWIAYAKGGKSTMLLNHGARAAQQYRKVLHFVLEGSVQLIANRYDAFFSGQAYQDVKKGHIGSNNWQLMQEAYNKIKGNLILVPLLEKWDYTILDVEAKLKDYRRKGWVPDMVIIDYGDLINGRKGPYRDSWESERDAIRDMKLLANRGYAVWSASQAQRPNTKTYNEAEHQIQSAQIAGGYEKVRVADFVGSINMTMEEKNIKKQARLWLETYRDNAAGKLSYVQADLATMTFGGLPQAPSAYIGTGPVANIQNHGPHVPAIQLGYGK